jgi:RNase P subunit RPR2
MSSQVPLPKGERAAPYVASQTAPACPKCQRPMTVKQVMPVLFASDIDDMVFGCAECGTEMKRTVKR